MITRRRKYYYHPLLEPKLFFDVLSNLLGVEEEEEEGAWAAAPWPPVEADEFLWPSYLADTEPDPEDPEWVDFEEDFRPESECRASKLERRSSLLTYKMGYG